MHPLIHFMDGQGRPWQGVGVNAVGGIGEGDARRAVPPKSIRGRRLMRLSITCQITSRPPETRRGEAAKARKKNLTWLAWPGLA